MHADFNDKEVEKAEDKLKLMKAKAEYSEENRQLAERRVGV